MVHLQVNFIEYVSHLGTEYKDFVDNVKLLIKKLISKKFEKKYLYSCLAKDDVTF